MSTTAESFYPQPNRDTWQNFAPCKGFTELFFSEDEIAQAIAIAMCHNCMVINFCKQAADSFGEKHGIWAGVNYYMPERKRQALAKKALDQETRQ